MDGNTSASRHKAHNLVSRNRAAALGETHRQIVDSLHHNAALGLAVGHRHRNLISVSDRIQDRSVCLLLLHLFHMGLHHLVDDLALLQAAVADGGKDRIPVLVGIALHHLFHELRLVKLRVVNALIAAVFVNHIAAADNIVFL